MKTIIHATLALTVLSLLSACGEKPKAEETKEVVVQNVKTESKFQVHCTYTEKSEEQLEEGGTATHEVSQISDFVSSVTKNSLSPTKRDKIAQGEVSQKTKITLPGKEPQIKEIQYTFVRESKLESRDLGNDLYQDLSSIKSTHQAKSGFNFGLDANQKPITTRTSSHTWDVISYEKDGRMQELSSKLDGKLGVPQEGIFEVSSKSEGKIRKTVYRLTEPVVNPMNPKQKTLIIEELCDTKDISPEKPAQTADATAPQQASSNEEQSNANEQEQENIRNKYQD